MCAASHIPDCTKGHVEQAQQWWGTQEAYGKNEFEIRQEETVSNKISDHAE